MKPEDLVSKNTGKKMPQGFKRYKIIIAISVFLYAFQGVAQDIPENVLMEEDPQVFVDWVPNAPGEGVCRGSYLEPSFEDSPANGTVITANSSLFKDVGESELSGNVVMLEPERRFQADQVKITRNADGEYVQATATGGILLTEPGFRVYGKEARVVFQNNETSIWQAEYRYYARHARGSASFAETAKDSPIILHDATYTTCAPGDNLWDISAKKVILDREKGRGTAWHTWMKVKDVPVLYLPYLNFPIDDRRQTGFLPPEYRSSTQNGFSIKAPYYINLAPNYDATISPYWMTKRGVQTGGEFRYLDRYQSAYFYGEYLPDDPAFAQFRDESLASSAVPDPNDPRRKNLENESNNRWMANVIVNGQYTANWSSYIEFNQVSDDEYLIDFGANDFSEDERLLRRRAELDYLDETWSAQLFVQDYQTIQPFDASLITEPYRIMPNAQVFYAPYWENQPFQFTLGAQGTVFQHSEDPLINETPTYGNRYHLEPTVGFPMRTAYGFFKPAVTLFSTQYDLTLSPTDKALGDPNSPQSTIPSTIVDTGLIFERDLNFFNQRYVQTLEPRLYYLFVPYHNQNDLPNFDTARYEFTTPQLFRNNRFSGFDRIGDANQVSWAITSRFYDYGWGIERFKATLGQIVYFEDRRVMLCNTDIDSECFTEEDPAATASTSPYVADILYRFNPQWYLMGDLRIDSHKTETDLVAMRFHYQPQERTIMHAGFRYEESGNLVEGTSLGDSLADLMQTDVGVSWAATQRLNLLGRWYYDIKNRFTVDTFGGLEYEDCCWAVRLGARRYLQLNTGEPTDRPFDTEYFLQFIFKGLGSLGNSPVEHLTTTLPGYQDRFEVID